MDTFHIIDRTIKGMHAIEVNEDWSGDDPADAVRAFLEEMLGDEEIHPWDCIEVRVTDHGVFRFGVQVTLVNQTPKTAWERVAEDCDEKAV